MGKAALKVRPGGRLITCRGKTLRVPCRPARNFYCSHGNELRACSGAPSGTGKTGHESDWLSLQIRIAAGETVPKKNPPAVWKQEIFVGPVSGGGRSTIERRASKRRIRQSRLRSPGKVMIGSAFRPGDLALDSGRDAGLVYTRWYYGTRFSENNAGSGTRTGATLFPASEPSR